MVSNLTVVSKDPSIAHVSAAPRHGLTLHRWRSFKLSNDDKAFVEKLHDVVGLYVFPPAHAIVLSVDEKSQIQALDRTQLGLPLKKGRGGTMTHDYNLGTTTLFAALNVLDGSVIGRNMQRHRHQEFIRFLNTIEAEPPKDKAVHVILDNYATHKQPKVRAWLARHPRWTFHSIPTACSWLNAVEVFFARRTRRRLKHGVFHSVVDLQADINRFVNEHNREPQPFIWKADPDEITAAVRRGHQTLEQATLMSEANLRNPRYLHIGRRITRSPGEYLASRPVRRNLGPEIEVIAEKDG
jgi:transposase